MKKLFPIVVKGKNSFIAGCEVKEGEINKEFNFRLLRNNKVVKEGLILKNMRVHKDNVDSV